MKLIHDRIEQNKTFVGRRKELSILEQCIATRPSEWGVIHLHGPAGMGKTVLLNQFERLHPHYPSIYIDGHRGFRDPTDFLRQVHDQLSRKAYISEPYSHSSGDWIHEINDIAGEHPVFLILLDGLDQWGDMLHWLRREWLKSLHVNVRVISAGRSPLHDWQLEFGWEQWVRHVEITPFSKPEWIQYANLNGIADARLIYRIGIMTEGIPLAVAMTCSWIKQQEAAKLPHEWDLRPLLELLERYFLAESNLNGVDKQLLTLASVPYTFDQEMLEYMLGEPIPAAAFAQLCHSPFVRIHASGGWCVREGYRRWARAGIRESFPDRFERYKQRAGDILERRIVANSRGGTTSDPLALEIGKLFLNENEIVHSFICFGNRRHYRMRDAEESELASLGEIYQRNLKNTPPYLEDDTHQEQYFREIWEARPSSIQVIESEDEHKCFIVVIPYNAKFRAILRRNPATHKWAATTVPERDDWFYWIISTWPAADPEMIGFAIRHVFLPSLPGKRITCMATSFDQAESARLGGFAPLASARYTTPGGLTFYFSRLDSRASTGQDATATTYPPVRNTQAPEAWFELTKRLLMTYHDPERQIPLLQQCRQFWGCDLPLAEVGERIRQTIAQHLDRLKEGDRQAHMQYLILQHAYLKKIGSHELVAERLNLPGSTYYRQLKKMIRSLAALIESHHPESMHPQE